MTRRMDIRTQRAVRNAHLAWSGWALRTCANRDSHIGLALCYARAIAAVAALSGGAACVWASLGCPGLTALGLN